MTIQKSTNLGLIKAGISVAGGSVKTYMFALAWWSPFSGRWVLWRTAVVVCEG